MLIKNKIILFVVPLLLATVSDAVAQKLPERRFIRQGNRTYDKGDFTGAEIKYKKALEKAPASFEAGFNMADALYRQGRFAEAAALSGELVSAANGNVVNAAKSYYNQGNALFQQRKLEEALEAYKNSLRLNPNDTEAKFNLAYTKKLLDKDQNQQNQNQDQNKQDQNQQNQGQNNQNQNQDNNQQNQNKDKQKGDQNQQPDNNKGQNDNKGQSGQSDGKMSKEEAESMLQAIQRSEDDTRKNVDQKRAKALSRSTKNW